VKLRVFYASAGHGHQRVAEVIAKVFRSRDLTEEEVHVEDSLASTSPLFRWIYPETYYRFVRHHPKLWGWFYETLDRPKIYALIKPFREWANQFEGGRLLKRMQKENPEHILCTHFFSAELFSRAKKQGKIKSTITTVITDFSPQSFWVNEGTDYYWVANDESKQDLKKRGVAGERVFVGGIPVDPVFMPSGRKKDILKKWGFSEDRFTLLLSSGSFGLGPKEHILRELDEFSYRIQCFVVCGNNRRLQKSLEAEQHSFPKIVFGFIDFMPELMEATDLLIAKSGGSTTVESLAKDLPMVVVHPIPGQEMRNAHFLKEHNASFFIEEPEQIKIILRNIFENAELLHAKHRAIQAIAKPHAADDLVSFILEHERSDEKGSK